jgi:hypothetical protein
VSVEEESELLESDVSGLRLLTSTSNGAESSVSVSDESESSVSESEESESLDSEESESLLLSAGLERTRSRPPALPLEPHPWSASPPSRGARYRVFACAWVRPPRHRRPAEWLFRPAPHRVGSPWAVSRVDTAAPC